MRTYKTNGEEITLHLDKYLVVSVLLTVRRWKYKVSNKALWSIFFSKLFKDDRDHFLFRNFWTNFIASYGFSCRKIL